MGQQQAVVTNGSGVQQRYARALVSTDLRASDSPSSLDIDAVIAAGLAGESLGSLLCRLRSEWEAFDHRHLLSLRAMMDAGPLPFPVPSLYAKLHVFHAARDALRNYTLAVASRQAQDIPTPSERKNLKHKVRPKQKPPTLDLSAIHSVSDSILDHLLDPACGHCCGRKFKFLPGTTKLDELSLCSHCEGTGRRPLFPDATSPDSLLGRAVLNEVERKMQSFDHLLRRYLPLVRRARLRIADALGSG